MGRQKFEILPGFSLAQMQQKFPQVNLNSGIFSIFAHA